MVNALSARLDIEVDRSPATQAMSFHRGAPGVFAGDGPEAPFTPQSGLHKGGRVKKGVTGTRIRFWPDRQIFTKDATFTFEELINRVRQTSFIVPGLELVIRDLRGDQPVEEKFRHDGGITEFCEFLAHDEPITDVRRLQGSESFTETVPMLDDKGHMTPQDVERDLGVDVALRWGTGYDTEVRSFVNVIATPKGGTHLSGFDAALTKTFNDAMRAAKVLKVNDTDVVKDDVLEGLTAVVTVRLAEPQFEGQTKEILGTPAARSVVRKVVASELKTFLTSTRRAEKAQAKLVMEKVLGASKTRIAARQHRETQRRKNALESSALPAKLADCRSNDVDRSELFIVEGDSALGTAKLARNSEFQALLPIRGKILNVQKAGIADVLKNVECSSIIQVVGAGSGRTFDVDAARYGRIIFMADADSDGAHIRCLLATLFFRYMPDLVTSGRVFTAVPPLHRRGRQPAQPQAEDDDQENTADKLRQGDGGRGPRWRPGGRATCPRAPPPVCPSPPRTVRQSQRPGRRAPPSCAIAGTRGRRPARSRCTIAPSRPPRSAPPSPGSARAPGDSVPQLVHDRLHILGRGELPEDRDGHRVRIMVQDNEDDQRRDGRGGCTSVQAQLVEYQRQQRRARHLATSPSPQPPMLWRATPRRGPRG